MIKMERYIFVIGEDTESLDLIFPWIENLLPQDDITAKAGGGALFRLMPVSQDFSQVWSQPTTSISQWVDLETFKQFMEENTHLNAENESIEKQDLESYLHKTIDSLPCTGSFVHMYIFLHENDLDCMDSYASLGGAIIRLVRWHHAKISIVQMDLELSFYGEKMTSVTNVQALSIREYPQPAQVSWMGEVSITDNVEKDGVIFSNFSFHCSNWDMILKQGFSSTLKKTVRKRGRKEQIESMDTNHSRPVCGQKIEVLQEVDLATFPLFLLTPWTFKLHAFCDTVDPDYTLIEHVQEQHGRGLLARLQVYPRSVEIPECSESIHRSTFAWREYILSASSSSSSPSSPKNICNCSDYIPSSFEYLHLLILPNNESPSTALKVTDCLKVRVLLTAKQIARNILGIVRRQNSSDTGDTQKSKREKEGEDEVKKSLNSLPVLKIGDLCQLIQRLSQDQEQAFEDLKNKTDVEEEELVHSSARQLEDILMEIPRTEHTITVGDVDKALENMNDTTQDWMSEAVYGLSKCPEWIALLSENSEHDLTQDSSFGSLSSSTVQSKKKSFEKSKSQDFSIDHVLSIFKGERAGKEGFQTPVKRAEGDNFPLRRHSDSSIDEPDGDKVWKQHDIYHYNSEADYDLEIKYAEIRDRGSFQDTQSSFVTPQKKANRQFQAVLPTRSSPRTKLFSRRLSLSQSPNKLFGYTPTFKHPQSVQNSTSSSGQRKRPASSLTPDSELSRPVKYSRTNSSPNLISSSAPDKRSHVSMISTSSSKENHKRVPFTTVLESSEPLVRRSPRKLPSSHSGHGDPARRLKRADSSQSSFESCKQERQSESTQSDQSSKMKRSERHLMRLKSIIANVLKEKGVKKGDPIHDACSKNLLNVSIILLKTLPNSKNLTDEMKSVVYEQVQQIINLEKRRSGIAL